MTRGASRGIISSVERSASSLGCERRSKISRQSTGAGAVVRREVHVARNVESTGTGFQTACSPGARERARAVDRIRIEGRRTKNRRSERVLSRRRLRNSSRGSKSFNSVFLLSFSRGTNRTLSSRPSTARLFDSITLEQANAGWTPRPNPRRFNVLRSTLCPPEATALASLAAPPSFPSHRSSAGRGSRSLPPFVASMRRPHRMRY